MRLALGVFEHTDVYGHAQGVCILSLDDEREVDGVNGVESRAALFDVFEKSGGEDVGVKRGGFAQLADPHIVDDGEDEGGGAAGARVVEDVILNSDFCEGLKFWGLIYGILQD